ncbi:hypothetical protein LTR04_005649 [Oleoguttula sp. CCFEE 6159]|nr:hypothetical protein LTR04_005649 [Oleoguttula sp. CCFEE 6159]
MAEKPAEHPEVAPDPDEDDLDDLDDVLDEFSATKIDEPPIAAASTTTTAPSASGPGRPAAATEPPSAEENDFAQQLEASMAAMLANLETDPEMKKQVEDMLKQLGGAASKDGSSIVEPEPSTASKEPAPASDTKSTAKVAKQPAVSAAPGKPSKGADADFQETIRKTMERMQESGAQAGAAAASSSEDDMLAQMLKEMEKGGFDGEGNEEDFSKMLLGMMEQLTNKEILYEPMKDLHDKFPAWLDKNSASTSAEDLARYKEQQTLVDEIVARFNRNGYSDDNAADREYIVDRMQKMQAAGSPPPDLVGDMNAAQDMLGDLDSDAQCPQQ